MDKEKVIETFDEVKELVWTDVDEYTVGYNDGLEAGKNIALSLLKEQNNEIIKLNGFINGFSRNAVPVVRCKNCRREEICCRQRPDDPNWYCADGISK